MAKLYVDMSRKYGAWTPVRETYKTEPSGKRVRYILCLHECGTESLLKPADLVNEKRLNCRKCRRTPIDFGKKYGSWTPLKEVHEIRNGKKVFLILCRCDCGSEGLLKTNELLGRKRSICADCRVKARVDLTKKYGSWTPIREDYEVSAGYKRRVVLCRCDCGNETYVPTWNLVNGRTKVCQECFSKTLPELTRTKKSTHGRSKTPEYNTWLGIKGRCYNPNDQDYHSYGGRGIKVCDRWLESFENFLEDMGERPGVDYSIDRVNVNGHYEKSNCRWTTADVQARNTRKNRMITHNGETLCLEDWAQKIGIDSTSLNDRLKRGWPLEKALTSPRGTVNHSLRIIEFQGKRQSLAEWSKQTGLDESVIAGRLKRGWTVEQALTTPSYGKHNREYMKRLIEFQGRTQGVIDWARETGIPLETLRSRLKLGWTVERTLTTPYEKKQLLEFNGRSQSVAAWSRETGIPRTTIRYRLENGWKVEQALTIPPDTHNRV